MTKKKSWDKGVYLPTIVKTIVFKLRKAKTPKSRAYLSILLIQALNGSRISEAVRAYLEWIKTGERKVYVKISKKRKEQYRKMKIPRLLEEMKEKVIVPELLEVDEKTLVRRLKVFCRDTLGINTHSLRYAYVTFLTEEGVESGLIAKSLGHSSLNHILKYVQEKKAEELPDLVEELLDRYL